MSNIYNIYKDQIADLLDQATSEGIDIVEMMSELGFEATEEMKAQIELDRQEA